MNTFTAEPAQRTSESAGRVFGASLALLQEMFSRLLKDAA